MKQVYAPGCALMLYKPELAGKVLDYLDKGSGSITVHSVCCRHEPGLEPGTQVINTCAGCDKRYGSLYNGIFTLSLWEMLAVSNTFPFPDYHGMKMTIHDACPTRMEVRVHDAVRENNRNSLSAFMQVKNSGVRQCAVLRRVELCLLCRISCLQEMPPGANCF